MARAGGAVRRYAFRLYVAGDAPRSRRAIQNLKTLCDERLAGMHHIEVVDVLREPRRAFQDGIVVTPTLVKLAPGESARIIGDLSDHGAVLAALCLLPERLGP